MDEPSRQTRQNDPSYQPADHRFMADPDQRQGRAFSSSSSQRYRPAPLQTPITARGETSATAYPAYYQEPASSSFASGVAPSAMPYQPSYSQQPRAQQTFASYGTDMMYNVTPQTSQSGVYDSSQQFHATRQPAALLLPDEAASYYSAEPSSASGHSALQQRTGSGSADVYQQQQQQQQQRPAGRSTMLQQSYPPSMGMGNMAQAASEMMETDDYQAAPAAAAIQPQAPPMEVRYNSYLTAMKGVFQNIVNARLSEASRSLLEVSEWLLGNVTELGLTVDEVTLHADRIKLWTEFNAAWLGVFQKQIDMLQARRSTRVAPGQTLISREFISKMAKDLIKMCDAVEKHGLVDYQYGVEEERIMVVLMECLDLQQSIDDESEVNPSQSQRHSDAPP